MLIILNSVNILLCVLLQWINTEYYSDNSTQTNNRQGSITTAITAFDEFKITTENIIKTTIELYNECTVSYSWF